MAGDTKEDIALFNQLGGKGVPFIFIISFDLRNVIIEFPDTAASKGIFYDINGLRNHIPQKVASKTIDLIKYPAAFDEFKLRFDQVLTALNLGHSYLLNLTFKTKISTNLTLREIFHLSHAKHKLLTPGFVVFSPETFIRINNRRIYSFPMKGTINADIPGAEKIIMNDFKELAEHTTIVDLIRNDLSIIAGKVNVDKFRYIEKIKTHEKAILQVSSIISGTLPEDYKSRIGDILFSMLPAGSISGAPKKRTLELIRDIEGYDRGFYTGIFGYFDGTDLESSVMIRFIENEGDVLYYKSGGGITVNSNPETEYQEMLDKIYVPVY